MTEKKDFMGNILILILILFLIIAGYISYKSIDWKVLNRIESQTLILPTPIPTISPTQIQISTPSSTKP